MSDSFSSLDVLRAYTAQFDVELGPDEEFLPHDPISADAAAELIRKWSTRSAGNPTGDPKDDRTWSMLQALADDYRLPLDEFLGAIWSVSKHNGAYKGVGVQDQVGCAVGEIVRVLETFDELTKNHPNEHDEEA